MLLVYHWSGGGGVQELLVLKPVSNWSPEDVALWLEHLGPWAALYRDSFDTEQVNGRAGGWVHTHTHTHSHTLIFSKSSLKCVCTHMSTFSQPLKCVNTDKSYPHYTLPQS